ncbi:MAG: hypothetical protein KJO42_03070 [Silicimonas sp.]|nr:hypothetical protein [Silicimonas sp.]NNF90216.1 hypothetical protein [Boseongicola sp.]RZW12724.1 MAG: hypothetical protein EX266_00290 [Paracoccaceae bacterium]MBT8423764.1 hypothetical protein [Silicimonas sp.]NND19669.1 hypothetical protein [Silicimonas sp.]
MALITDAATGWSSPITLTTDEIWQTRKGSVFLTTTATPDPDDGIQLNEGNAVQLASGATVRYRKAGPAAAWVVRETVG